MCIYGHRSVRTYIIWRMVASNSPTKTLSTVAVVSNRVPMRANPYPVLPNSPPVRRRTDEIHANTATYRNGQAMSMFRASPWVTYDPSVNIQPEPLDMDEDVDMDAPHISTLREEVTPPPVSKSASASRRNKASAKPRTASWSRPLRKEPLTEEEYEDAEEEEDQLIDDDDDDDMKPVPPAALSASRSGDSASKRRSPAKKKPRKSDKRAADDGKNAGEKAAVPLPLVLEAPPLTWLASAHDEDAHKEQPGPSGAAELVPPKVVTPKKPTPKASKPKVPKATTTPSKGKGKLPTKLKLTLPLLIDDPDFHSEGYTGTAASSPVTVHFDINTPEPEPPAPLVPVTLPEETNLENVLVPVYPLPTKPFPVQPPPKIHTGFAPIMPLDKSHKKVRHWRVAHREIRGIGGGRWFARSWVGEKESELAATGGVSKTGESTLALPKLISISAPASGRSSKSKASKAASSLAASAAPSRAGSSIPDVPTSTVRAPTKMRTIIAPPMSDDSDMAAPPDL